MSTKTKVTSAKAQVAPATSILATIKQAYKTATTSREAAAKAKEARDLIRKLYVEQKTEFMAAVETIADVKMKVWVMKVALWKPADKTEKVAAMTVKTAIDFLLAHGYTLLKNGNLAQTK
jgi:23S rRNA A2030 N6-methylase RlmJ